MGLYSLLQYPVIYDWKTRMLSFGRQSVLRYLAERAHSLAGRTILDVGCGTGRHADAFPERFCGIDYNSRYVRHAAKRHRGMFAVMDATRMAFVGEAFDLVFSAGLCHHLSDRHVRNVAAEMKRVTKNGGEALIIDGVRPRMTNLLGYLLSKMDRGKYPRTLNELVALLTPEEFRLTTESIKGSFPYRRAVFAYLKRCA